MGALRLFLALSVIADHSFSTVFGFNGIGAAFAVNYFFVISGFYMAMVLTEKYATTSPSQFYKSRALRLFPTYYIGLLLALVLSYEEIIATFSQLSLGTQIFYVFQNLFMLGQDISLVVCESTVTGECPKWNTLQLNTPAWSLAVELYFYLAAPFIVREPKRIYLFILVGIAYFLLINGIALPLTSNPVVDIHQAKQLTYFFYPSSFVFFGVGALAYHIHKKSLSPNYFLIMAGVVLLAMSPQVLPSWILIFVGLAIPVLFKYTAKNKFDRVIGELSYPAYILHFPILGLLKKYTESHPEMFEIFSIGTWVALISCSLGLLIYFVLEKRVNLYRETITEKDKNQADSKGMKLFARSYLSVYLLFPFVILAFVHHYEYPLAETTLDLDSGHWSHGVNQKTARLLITPNPKNEQEYAVGRTIIFSDGQERVIAEVKRNNKYLVIEMHGEPLDGDKVGFPNKISVSD